MKTFAAEWCPECQSAHPPTTLCVSEREAIAEAMGWPGAITYGAMRESMTQIDQIIADIIRRRLEAHDAQALRTS